MSAVPATRTELLQRRAQTAFAEQGRDLIMDKRTALMREVAALRRDLLSELSELGELAARARETLSAAVATDGHVAVRSAALGSADGIRVALMSRTVAGVPIFELTRSPVRHDPRHRGWASVVVSIRVDAVAEAYEEYLERLLDLCALELTVRGMASEIARATRQVNALENVMLPRIATESASIARVLDEHEREERGASASPDSPSPTAGSWPSRRRSRLATSARARPDADGPRPSTWAGSCSARSRPQSSPARVPYSSRSTTDTRRTKLPGPRPPPQPASPHPEPGGPASPSTTT